MFWRRRTHAIVKYLRNNPKRICAWAGVATLSSTGDFAKEGRKCNRLVCSPHPTKGT